MQFLFGYDQKYSVEISHTIVDLVCLGIPNYSSVRYFLTNPYMTHTVSKHSLGSGNFRGSIFDMIELALGLQVATIIFY